MASGFHRLSVITLPVIDGIEFLTEPRRAALLYLRARRKKSVSTERILGEVASRFGTTIHSLKQLEEKKLVEYEGDPEDRSEGKWKITPEGLEMARELVERMQNVERAG